MQLDQVIDVSSSESDGEQPRDRREIYEPVVRQVVDALGGCEGGVYRMGYQALGCLKDLKKLWRTDDTDDERTMARIFWDTRVLSNDLVPILLETAGKGLVEDKRAIACADLITAMTWPIDLAEELKELDEELDKGTDYTQLTISHLHYKAALLKPGVIQALFGLVLPPLAKPPKERPERDGQIVNVVLHLFRNLAFIRDLPVNAQLSADQAEYSTLQARLIRAFSETHTLDLLLTIATNASNDPLLNGWNTLILEIFYLLFRGVKPSSLAIDQKKAPSNNLDRLLTAEASLRRGVAQMTASRHSRFGTTISVTLNTNKTKRKGDSEPAAPAPQPIVLHRQQAIGHDYESVIDIAKKQRSKKGNKLDDLATEDNLSIEARVVLKELAKEFLESSFNSFLSSVLKDIKSERPKITEKDNLRLMYVTRWFLEFYLRIRAKEGLAKWGIGLVAEVTDRSWIIWVLKRMRQAVEDKPKLWTELQAGIECLTKLLELIDAMTSSTASESDSEVIEAAEILQQQLIYNGEVLDMALEGLRSYKEGTQTLTYLDSSVSLAYSLLKMLERWGKKKPEEVYVRRKARRRRRKGPSAEDEAAILDVEEEAQSDQEVIRETIFTFEAFEMKFAHSEITKTLLTYLAGYKDFTSPEQMKRVVNLLHRQAVRTKAEGLFFDVSTLHLMKTILADQNSLPTDQPYKDLIALVKFVLRQFFKALEKDPFLAVEAFFPKNRGHWKQFSSWEPEEKLKRGKHEEDDSVKELQVKKGFSETEQIGVVIAALIENNKGHLVDWVTDVLTMVVAQRRRIVEEVDNKQDEDEEVDEQELIARLRGPSTDAIAKFEDCRIPCITEQQAHAATSDPQLKLLFRLCNFQVQHADADELEWYVPAAITPRDLQTTLGVVRKYVAAPFEVDGKQASALLKKKAIRRRRRRSSPSDSDADGDAEGDVDDEKKKARKGKRKKEKEVYKSAATIADSDEEYADMDAFLEKEKALREKTARIQGDGGRLPTMKSAGTKKRTRPREAADKAAGKQKRRRGVDDVISNGDSDRADSGVLPERTGGSPHPDSVPDTNSPSSTNGLTMFASSSRVIARGGDLGSEGSADEDSERLRVVESRRRRIVISDDDE